MGKASASLQPSVAVVGGGVNGLCCAWQLALRGAKVTLFEQDKLFATQHHHANGLLHGGMEHLTNGELRLAYEALQERQWLQQQCPELCSPVPITVPLYAHGPRQRWLVNAGLHLYEHIVSNKTLPRHRWLKSSALSDPTGELQPDDLLGAYRYHELRIDENQLQRWIAQQATAAGVDIVEHSAIRHIGSEGSVHLDSHRHQFDFIVNAIGAESLALLQQSGLSSKNHLTLIRENYVVLPGQLNGNYHVPITRDSNSLYVLPWHGHTLVGASTTIQTVDEETELSEHDIDYLLYQYNRLFTQQRRRTDIIKVQWRLRHRIKSSIAVSHLSNEYLFERQQKLLTVFGGHWTTARALGQKVAVQLFD